ncbi:hypothetical protein GCM10009854_29220 [Saccharopolyspora halophila]|uniref:Uncharacterized protein n=2 Tax=Saccharopolyspora halophila TaxID=405551 RepID=A0ABP5TEJ4_9PSEU
MHAETDLFGNPVAPLEKREQRRPEVNDMELIEKVLRAASRVGFVLVGVREDVYKRLQDDEVERVPEHIDAAVHQLIEAKWLEIGGTHHVRYDRYQGPARSVLIPTRSRRTAYRWAALQPLPKAA